MKKTVFTILFFLSFTISKSQTFDWVASISTGVVIGGSQFIVSDNNGHIYVTGSFAGSLIFPGPGGLNDTIFSVGGDDFYIAKLDTSGNFIWCKSIGVANGFIGAFPISFSNGSLYLTGTFSDSIDIDLGIGISILYADSGMRDAFICKVDTAGNLVWVKEFNGNDPGISPIGYPKNYLDKFGNIYLNIMLNDTIDLDPGVSDSIFYPSNSTYKRQVIAKYDSNGNFMWGRGYDNIFSDGFAFGYSYIGSDNLQNIIVGGHFDGQIDLDPGTGTTIIYDTITTVGLEPVFLSKLDPNGNFISGFCPLGRFRLDKYDNIDATYNGLLGQFLGSTVTKYRSDYSLIFQKNQASSGLVIDNQSNSYSYGTLYASPSPQDLDPGPGSIWYTANTDDSYLKKFDGFGNLIWAFAFGGGINYEGCTSICFDSFGNLYAAGQFAGMVDFDPSPSTHIINGGGKYILKLKQDKCANFALIVDTVADITCTNPVGFIQVHAEGGYGSYSYQWNTTPFGTDSIIYPTTGGFYNISVTDSLGCSRSTSVLISYPPAAPGFDLQANLIMGSTMPGDTSFMFVNAFNDGCANVTGQLQLIIDQNILINSINPAPSLISGDTIFWSMAVANYDSSHFSAYIDYTVSTSAILGDSLCLKVLVDPIALDTDTSNNIKSYCYLISGSFDPNDKQVFPQGECTPKYILKNDTLTYMIRFQNTGNAPAINVIIVDTLSPKLSINSMRVIGNSHNVITELLPGSILEFRFNNIMLPDSISNEPESHGYVIYEIMPDSSAAFGTQIKNKAAIYFDFNLPIITNEVVNAVSNGTHYPSNTVTQNGSVLTAQATGATYQWVDCNNNFQPIAGAVSQSYSPSVNGNYAVLIRKNNCDIMSNCINITNVGIQNVNNSDEFTVYPNPTNGALTLEWKTFKNKNNLTINVSDAFGKILFSKNSSELKTTLNQVSDLPAGIYFIEVSNDNGYLRKKFIKQ